MFNHIMVSSDDIKRSKRFYDSGRHTCWTGTDFCVSNRAAVSIQQGRCIQQGMLPSRSVS
jgi:hypothetical protein